jgi:hypothetical protein
MVLIGHGETDRNGVDGHRRDLAELACIPARTLGCPFRQAYFQPTVRAAVVSGSWSQWKLSKRVAIADSLRWLRLFDGSDSKATHGPPSKRAGIYIKGIHTTTAQSIVVLKRLSMEKKVSDRQEALSPSSLTFRTYSTATNKPSVPYKHAFQR